MVKCRNSTGTDYSQKMKNVFDQHTNIDRNGNVTGGSGKHHCLHDGELGRKIVLKLVKTPCRNIIEELRALFHDFYLLVDLAPELSEDSDFDGLLTDKAEQEQKLRVQRVLEATKKIDSSKWMLEMINRHLSSKWGVDDDSSLHRTVLRPDSAASRDRRKRKAEGSSEENMTFAQRRRGRLPPRSTEPSRNSVWSQGTHSQSQPHSGTLLGSSSYSATRVSTLSQSTRSQSRGGKLTSRGR